MTTNEPHRTAQTQKRRIREKRRAEETWTSPHPFYRVAALSGLFAGVGGWVTASTYRGPMVPAFCLLAILLGLLGVRSRYRPLGLLGFIMGMFLLPNAISVILQLLRG